MEVGAAATVEPCAVCVLLLLQVPRQGPTNKVGSFAPGLITADEGVQWGATLPARGACCEEERAVVAVRR